LKAIHLDYETRSRADIRKFGGHRYAVDPTTEVFFAAVSEDKPDAPVFLWVNPKFEIPGVVESDPEALPLIGNAFGNGWSIYAHNAAFEAAITGQFFDMLGAPNPKLEQWRCTAAMARRAAIPSSLDGVGEFLGLTTTKDKTGKALIQKFSIPAKSGKRKGEFVEPHEDPEAFRAFRAFGEYCKKDVVVEKLVHRELAAFELKGVDLESFQFDMRMNNRGVLVNIPAMEKTQILVEEFEAQKVEEFRAMTGLNPSQREKVLGWLNERGYPGKDMTAATVQDVLDNGPEAYGMTAEAFKALVIKNQVGFAALKKIPTMLGAACPDSRVRGAFMWSGAERTHRTAGRIIQPQNFRRPTVPQTGLAFKLLSRGTDSETLEALFGPTLETVASCIRHFVMGPAFDADYSAIEARINPWLCGQEDKLEAFRRKEPIYENMASRIFQKLVSEIGSRSIERFVGKTSELGCGYNMGADKFKATCEGYGQNISQELAEKAVAIWRKSNPIIVSAWKSIDRAAKDAIKNPGKTFSGVTTNRIRFGMTKKGGFSALAMLLPSGHKLIYPRAFLKPVFSVFVGRKMHKFYDQRKAEQFARDESGRILRAGKPDPGLSVSHGEEVQFWGKLPGQSNKWGWVSSYGGKFLENACQATAGDILTNGLLIAEKAGFEVCMVVHDQALATYNPDLSIELFCKCLCDLPAWADGLPIEAEGAVVPYYLK